MMTDDQIEAMVMKKFPKTDKESWCAIEKQRLKYLRDIYREQLMTQQVDLPTLN
jgi:predicted NUDIX family NTP pyrophosphohydrolase